MCKVQPSNKWNDRLFCVIAHVKRAFLSTLFPSAVYVRVKSWLGKFDTRLFDQFNIILVCNCLPLPSLQTINDNIASYVLPSFYGTPPNTTRHYCNSKHGSIFHWFVATHNNHIVLLTQLAGYFWEPPEKPDGSGMSLRLFFLGILAAPSELIYRGARALFFKNKTQI